MGIRFGGAIGRSLGGRNSQLCRKINPGYYRKRGCNVAIDCKFPEKSDALAEIVGVILGDGGLSYNQLHITLNSIKDHNYCFYLKDQIEKVFGMKVGVFKKKNANAIELYVSGVNFVQRLVEIGMRVGNKTRLQVAVPGWIVDNLNYSKCCLKGLMDTDGGVFRNTYLSNKKKYSYLKMCFTNKSVPLIDFVYNTLLALGYRPSKINSSKVWISSQKRTLKYLNDVGTSNQRLILALSK